MNLQKGWSLRRAGPSTLRSITLSRFLAGRNNLGDLEGNAMRGATEDGLGEGEWSSDGLIRLIITVVEGLIREFLIRAEVVAPLAGGSALPGTGRPHPVVFFRD
jgi:hypothetical protein